MTKTDRNPTNNRFNKFNWLKASLPLLQIKHAQNGLPAPEIFLHRRGEVHRLAVGFQPIDAVSSGPDGDDVLRADIVDIETGGSPPHT